MIREVCYALAITLLSGCTAICPEQPTTFVVAQVPPPPIIQRPQLKAWEITQDTPDGVVVQYWRVTVEQLISYSKELELIVEGYREMASQKGEGNNKFPNKNNNED